MEVHVMEIVNAWKSLTGKDQSDPKHTVFHCQKYAVEKRSLIETLTPNLIPERIIDPMLKSKDNWLIVASVIWKIRISPNERRKQTKREVKRA